MKKFVFCACCVILLSSCEPTDKQVVSDAEYSLQILGTWIAQGINESMQPGSITYYSNGALKGSMAQGILDENDVFIKKRTVFFSSEWKIEKGVVISFNNKTDLSDKIGNDEVIKDKIVYINELEAKYINLSYGMKFMRYRQKNN